MNKITYMYSGSGVRVWTDTQAAYGQFDVMESEDFEQLKAIFEKYKWPIFEQV